MGWRIGRGYIASNQIKTTTELNQEIIPVKPQGWTIGYNCYKFSFMNYNDCTVIINGVTEAFLPANQGFNINEIDQPIKSFKIKEIGVSYIFIGAY